MGLFQSYLYIVFDRTLLIAIIGRRAQQIVRPILPFSRTKAERDVVKSDWKGQRSYPAAVHLIFYGFAVALPLVLVLAMLLFWSASVGREQTQQRILQVLDSLTNTIDRDLYRNLTILQTLATSAALDREDWPAFYDQSKRALQGKAYIVLADASGRQLVNTYVPYGQAPAMTGDLETVRRVADGNAPAVSNLFTSLVVKKPVFNVDIPVLRNGKIRFVMALGLLSDDLVSLLAGQSLDPHWVTMIWDARSVILARSRDNARYIGTLLPSNLQVQRGAPAVVKTTSLDGQEVFHAATFSKISGWGVGVNVPISFAERLSRHSVLLLSTAAGLAIILAVGFGLLFARLLTKPLVAAATAAAALGHGQPFKVAKSRLKEINAFNDALDSAQREIAQRTKAEKMLVRELQHRTNNLLAVIQSLAHRSLSDPGSVDEARVAFEARLHALARAYRPLTKSNWTGVSLHEIVRQTLEPFAARANIDGAGVMLGAKDAQNFSLIVHELATNAVKYGALSNASGKVSIVWTVAGNGSDTALTFRWQERGGPPAIDPKRQGFGTALLKATFSKVDVNYASEGLTCEFQVPLGKVELSMRADEIESV